MRIPRARLIRTPLRAALAATVIVLASAAPGVAATPQLSTGQQHTCAVTDVGEIRCFGNNFFGQLGVTTNVGTSNPNPVPMTIALGAPATQVSASSMFTCVLQNEGTVKCFGSNSSGRLGNPFNSGTSNANPTPLPAALAGPATAISAGGSHSCAVLSNSTVQCFGGNVRGQLGDASTSGTIGDHPIPATAIGGAGVRTVSAGGEHTCAILATGDVACWGLNQFGQLGNATSSGTNAANPGALPTDLGPGALAVDAGSDHTCALMGDSSVRCFGRNRYGQLGSAPNSGTDVANYWSTAVSAGHAAKAVAAGNVHTCVLLDDGQLKCFGSNEHGQLGVAENFGTTADNHVPQTVPLSEPAVAVDAGSFHTCALLASGAVQCFGLNNRGELGIPAGAATYTPSTVAGLELFVPTTPDPTPPTATPGPLAAKFAKPRIRARLKGARILLTTRARLTATGMSASTCTGKVVVTLRAKRRRIVRKRFALRYRRNTCTASVRLRIAAKHRRKRARISFALTGTTTVSAKSRTVSKRL